MPTDEEVHKHGWQERVTVVDHPVIENRPLVRLRAYQPMGPLVISINRRMRALISRQQALIVGWALVET